MSNPKNQKEVSHENSSSCKNLDRLPRHQFEKKITPYNWFNLLNLKVSCIRGIIKSFTIGERADKMNFILTLLLSLHFFSAPAILVISIIVDLSDFIGGKLSQSMSDSQLILYTFIIFCKFLFLVYCIVVATFYFKRHVKAPKLIILYMLVLLTINGIIYFASINSSPIYALTATQNPPLVAT